MWVLVAGLVGRPVCVLEVAVGGAVGAFVAVGGVALPELRKHNKSAMVVQQQQCVAVAERCYSP